MTTVGERLRTRLATEGRMPFSDFMEEALYGAGGYYRRAAWPIGGAGDFVTGPALGELLARATARLLARLDGALGAPAELLEVGYGDGAHIAAVTRLAGGSRRLRGVDRGGRPLPAEATALASLDEVAPGEVDGLVFSYELFDALPVHRVRGAADGGLEELWVGLDETGSFAWQEGPLADPRLADLLGRAGARLAAGQIADVALGWEPLYRALAARLGRGLVVTCDYGFAGGRLYDPRTRPHGTLACHRRHRVHRDALADPGGQDLTAHVDFELLRRTGEEEGLATLALTRQALWLVACGLFADLAGAAPRRRHEALALLDPDGMGEEIAVLVQGRGIDPGGLFEVPLAEPSRGRLAG